MIGAIVAAFATSSLLYGRTHRVGFPEMGRYAIGGLLVMLCYALLHPGDREGLYRLAVAFFTAGVGVGFARIWEVLL